MCIQQTGLLGAVFSIGRTVGGGTYRSHGARIARMFGGIVNNVDDESGSGDCDVSDCFCVVPCDQVACDYCSSSLY